jgi:hypothetical protein
MLMPGKGAGNAELAKSRLLQDQRLRSLARQRVLLAALSLRLEGAGRQAVLRLLAAHVQEKPQLAPLLRRLQDRTHE